MAAWPIACVQTDVSLAQINANTNRVISHLEAEAKVGTKLVIFPECMLTGYGFASPAEANLHALTRGSDALNQVEQACSRLNIHACLGFLESDGNGRLFNTAVLTGPPGHLGWYRKTHLPWLGVDRWVTPGNGPWQVHDLGGLRVGMIICYDGSFPESPRALALLGADLIILPTNWPEGARTVIDHLVTSRAVENHLYFAACNRIGTESGFRFLGESRIVAPDGSFLACSNDDSPAVLRGSVDPNRARKKHLVRVPGGHEIHRMADRRPDLYGILADPDLKPAFPPSWIPPRPDSHFRE